MRARQFPCDAQPETVPRSLLVTSCPIEAFENVWCAFRWNSRAAVADADLHDVIMFFGRNQNLTARSIIFYGILHQVLQRQRNHFVVAVHRKGFGNIGFDLKIIPSAQDPGIFQASVEQFAQVATLTGFEPTLKVSRLCANTTQTFGNQRVNCTL